MLKRFNIAFCLVLLCTLARAQGGPGQSNSPNAVTSAQSGAPTGNCSTNQYYVNTSNGDLYDCPSGSWVKVAGSLPSGLSYAAPTLTVSSAGNGSGALALSGNTSGACSHTASATGATETGTCQQLGPVGTPSVPTYSYTGDTQTGLFRNSAGVQILASNGVNALYTGGGFELVGSTTVIGWTSSTNAGGSQDTALSRDAVGVVDVGNASQGNTTGRLKAAGYISAGTKFTSNAGCTESTLVGGATAGKFTVGQGTACTIILTMGDTATAPNGWTCTAYDQTAVPAVAIRQTASTTTTCSLLMTVATSDVITFSAIGF